MTDNDFTIKNASKILDCSTQNIYGQKNELMKLGYMKQDEISGYYLTADGINYLKEKRTATLKAKSCNFNQVDNQELSSNENAVFTSNKEIIDLLKEQLQEAKKEKEYWKTQAETKDQELKEKNFYIQELNTKAFALLGTTEQNKQQEEQTKKSFWKRLFN